MADKQTPELTQIRNRIHQEVARDAPILAKRLFGNRSDATPQQRKAFIKYVRTMWDDAGFRQRLLERIGPRAFIAVSAEAAGQPAPTYTTSKEGRVTGVKWNDPLAGLPPVDPADMLAVSQNHKAPSDTPVPQRANMHSFGEGRFSTLPGGGL